MGESPFNKSPYFPLINRVFQSSGRTQAVAAQNIISPKRKWSKALSQNSKFFQTYVKYLGHFTSKLAM